VDIFDEVIDDADTMNGVATGPMKELSGLVKQTIQLGEDIEGAEEALKNLKKQKQALVFDRIPSLMDEMGVTRVDVEGYRVTTKPVIHASIPVARKEEAFEWLRERNLDDIIKNDVILSFGKGQDNEVGHVLGLLRDQGLDPDQKTQVHSMTLKAFIRERIETGAEIDFDLFGAFIQTTAELKRT